MQAIEKKSSQRRITSRFKKLTKNSKSRGDVAIEFAVFTFGDVLKTLAEALRDIGQKIHLDRAMQYR